MSKYKDIFTDFARALDNESHAIECISDTTKSNFSIYRNNIQINRINALRIAYPSIDSLLGTEFFDAMSLIYVQQSPASHANLHEEGADFPQFIAHFTPAADYFYLADVARLDWAIHCAHYAPDVAVHGPERIAQYANQLETLKFEFHPAMAQIESPHPIATIFEMHHGGKAPDDLNKSECVLVWRDQYAKISASEYHFFAALQAKQTLADALDAVAEFDPEFNPANAMSLMLQHGLISNIIQA